MSITNGHTHDLKFEHIVTEVTIEAGKVNETQLTCADGSKGIVADMDLDDGLKSLGNDPRPVTRAFKIYNPTDHALKARLSLLCLGLRTGGEHAPPVTLINTAMISTISFESQTGNNTSSATVIAEDTDNHTPVTPTPPVKPVPNNPIAQTRIGGNAFLKKSGVTGSDHLHRRLLRQRQAGDAEDGQGQGQEVQEGNRARGRALQAERGRHEEDHPEGEGQEGQAGPQEEQARPDQALERNEEQGPNQVTTM